MVTFPRIIILAYCCALLFGCGQGVSTFSTTIEAHAIVIVDAAGGGGESVTHVKPDGTEIFTHTSASGSIRLENEILTVNGVKYSIPSPTDSIRIVDGNVQLNGSAASPDAG